MFSRKSEVLFWMRAKHHKPPSAVGWQTVWVTETGTGVGVAPLGMVDEASGISKVPPTDMLFGITSGFAARSASCEILNCSASSLNVSPDLMIYTNGVEVGTGVSRTTSTFGVNVSDGVALGRCSVEALRGFGEGVDAHAARTKIVRANK